MSYFLKKSTPSSKGLYLQIYQSHYTPGVGTRNKSFQKIGYVSDLIKNGIEDPILYYQNMVNKLNEDLKDTKTLQISDKSTSLFLGHFLIKSMFDLLDMDRDLNIVSSGFNAHYTFSDLFRTLSYSQILSPGSKLKAFEKVIPNIYGTNEYSYDQILDFVHYIGSDYHKYIEVLNKHISDHWNRNYNKVYFDCTNYYFEIDAESEFLKKGPSKENRKNPLLGQALLLDADQIPLDTEFYPGNESEKPYIRKRIENMKIRNNVQGRVIQVADKGLNCARNIYSAVVEANDGYIFSKAIRGNMINKEMKNWIFNGNEDDWINIYGPDNMLHYKYKVFKTLSKKGKTLEYGLFEYKCKINPEDSVEETFRVKEKRILTYNPALAKKQKNEIYKQINKLKNLVTYKQIIHEDLGDSSKYLVLEAKDLDGKKVKIATSLNKEKIEEDLNIAGYNMLITSEIDVSPIEIYKTYHNLWRIEESFRILKTYLEARPVYLTDIHSIYGHFTICYISLTILRLLELKTFEDKLPLSQIVDFIRQYKITKTDEESYINNSTISDTYYAIKEKLGLSKLGNVYLSTKDVKNILDTKLE